MANKDYTYNCLTKDDIINDGGAVIENEDGTISVYIQTVDGLVYQPLTKSCCEALATTQGNNGLEPLYTFDIDNQKCRWGAGCIGDTKPFKVILNPVGNDGAIFNINEANGELCTVKISFDYLFQVNCDDIWARITEINETNGLDAETNAQVVSLQSQQEKCSREIEIYTSQIELLEIELTETPYVIKCITITEADDTVVIVNEPKTFTPNPNGGNLDIGFGGIVRKFPSLTTSYCLTDLGLQSWLNILGVNDYNTWFNSNGTNTSVYNCDDVNALIEEDASSGNLLGTCNVEITTRQEIIDKITNLQTALIDAENKCESLTEQINTLLPDIQCSTVSEIFESLDISMTLDVYNETTELLDTVYEETLINIGENNLPTYITTTTPNTGFYSSGATSGNCVFVGTNLLEELSASFPTSGTTEIQGLVDSMFNSSWLHYETEITDPVLLEMIYNEKINISFLVNNCCVDFSILVDRIKLTKNCSLVDNIEFNITKNPSFDMVRVIDNKKSWLAKEVSEHREFDLKFRDTQYDINNYKLAINSKEVDLDINPANAIEQDVYCYVKDNYCLIECYSGNTGTTCTGNTCGDNCCVNLDDLLTTPLSAITSADEFRNVISSELIDAKHWKTLPSYPTLRLLYERYLNSTEYCGTLSSQFNYSTMMAFSELVGVYWVDLIEQVVPSTTIWGSTYVYGNTIFDQQKMQYKKYSFFGCERPDFGGDVVSPVSGYTNLAEVKYEIIENHNYDDISGSTTGTTFEINDSSCIGAAIIQSNCGSEFVGMINVIGLGSGFTGNMGVEIFNSN